MSVSGASETGDVLWGLKTRQRARKRVNLARKRVKMGGNVPKQVLTVRNRLASNSKE
jgi:hypothetical protein